MPNVVEGIGRVDLLESGTARITLRVSGGKAIPLDVGAAVIQSLMDRLLAVGMSVSSQMSSGTGPVVGVDVVRAGPNVLLGVRHENDLVLQVPIPTSHAAEVGRRLIAASQSS